MSAYALRRRLLEAEHRATIEWFEKRGIPRDVSIDALQHLRRQGAQL